VKESPKHSPKHVGRNEEARVNGLAEPAPREPSPEPVSLVTMLATAEYIVLRMVSLHRDRKRTSDGSPVEILSRICRRKQETNKHTPVSLLA